MEMIADMIHCAFKELMAHGSAGRSEQVTDLAHAFHLIPAEMHGFGGFSWQKWHDRLAAYKSKYQPGQYSPKYDYVDILQQIRNAR